MEEPRKKPARHQNSGTRRLRAAYQVSAEVLAEAAARARERIDGGSSCDTHACVSAGIRTVSYTHLDVYKRQTKIRTSGWRQAILT